MIILCSQFTRSSYSSDNKTDKPLPFLETPARQHKLRDSFEVDKAARKRQRFAIPLGLTIFGIIMYMGFIRSYDTSDAKVVDHLTRDIRDRYPEAAEKLNHIDIDSSDHVTEPSPKD